MASDLCKFGYNMCKDNLLVIRLYYVYSYFSFPFYARKRQVYFVFCARGADCVGSLSFLFLPPLTIFLFVEKNNIKRRSQAPENNRSLAFQLVHSWPGSRRFPIIAYGYVRGHIIASNSKQAF